MIRLLSTISVDVHFVFTFISLFYKFDVSRFVYHCLKLIRLYIMPKSIVTQQKGEIIIATLCGAIATYGLQRLIDYVLLNQEKKHSRDKIKQDLLEANSFFDWHSSDYKFSFSFIQKNEVRIRGEQQGKITIQSARFTYELLPDQIQALYPAIQDFWKELITENGRNLDAKSNHLYFSKIIGRDKVLISLPLHQKTLSDAESAQKLKKDYLSLQTKCKHIEDKQALMKMQVQKMARQNERQAQFYQAEIQKLRNQNCFMEQKIRNQNKLALYEKEKNQTNLNKQLQQLLSFKCTRPMCPNKIISWSIENYVHQYSTMAYCWMCFSQKKC